MVGQVQQPTKTCNFRPVILRILSASGDDAKEVLPLWLSRFANDPTALASMKDQLIKIDPSLTQPVLKSVEKNSLEEKGTWYDVFGSVKRGEESPAIQYVENGESTDYRGRALVLAKLLTPIQKELGQRLSIEYNFDQNPVDATDDSHFAISSFGNRRIDIVLPDPLHRDGNYLIQCLEEVRREIDGQWKDMKSSDVLKIDLRRLAKKFDAERKKNSPFGGGGMGGGGMF